MNRVIDLQYSTSLTYFLNLYIQQSIIEKVRSESLHYQTGFQKFWLLRECRRVASNFNLERSNYVSAK